MLSRYIAGSIIGVSVVAVIAVSYAVIRKKDKIEKSVPTPSETVEEHFVREWTSALIESAKTFNGLYQGLQRVLDGKAKKPEKVLREWCARTRYRWEQQMPSKLCEELIVPLLESGDQTAFVKWSGLLLQAAAAAGIARGTAEKLTLDESNVNDYTEWEGENLYVEDTVEIIFPAWYQNGVLLEQGNCRKKEEENV